MERLFEKENLGTLDVKTGNLLYIINLPVKSGNNTKNNVTKHNRNIRVEFAGPQDILFWHPVCLVGPLEKRKQIQKDAAPYSETEKGFRLILSNLFNYVPEVLIGSTQCIY